MKKKYWLLPSWKLFWTLSVIFLLITTSAICQEQEVRKDSILSLAETLPVNERISYLIEEGSKKQVTGRKQAEYLTKAIELAEEVKDTINLEKAKVQLVKAKMRDAKPYEAIKLIKELEANFVATGRESETAPLYLLLMKAYQVLSNYDSSFVTGMRALAYFKAANDTNNIAETYGRLGDIFLLDDPVESRKFYDLARPYVKPTTYEHASLLSREGLYFTEIKQFDKALAVFDSAEQVYRDLNHSLGIAEVNAYRGVVYYDLDKPDSAILCFRAALEIYEQIEYTYNVLLMRHNVAVQLYKKNDYEKALEMVLPILKASERDDLKRIALKAHNLLFLIYQKTGNYKMAYEHAVEYINAQEDLVAQERADLVTEMTAKFDLEQKDQSIAQQQQHIDLLEKQHSTERTLRIVLIVAIGLLLLLALVLLNRYHIKQRSEIRLNAKNAEIKRINLELEKRLLRAQMNPHFVFNSLTAIQHFITIQDKTSALLYLGKFSKLIRQTLDNSISINVSIAEEIKVLEYYLELESLRFKNRFTYCVHVEEGVDIHNTEIPFLLIQPYVENAVIHGFRKKELGGKLEISFKRYSHDFVQCIVQDNGIGRDKSKRLRRDSHISHGTNITMRRIAILNKQSMEKASVKVSDVLDENNQCVGTRVELFIPTNLNEHPVMAYERDSGVSDELPVEGQLTSL